MDGSSARFRLRFDAYVGNKGENAGQYAGQVTGEVCMIPCV